MGERIAALILDDLDSNQWNVLERLPVAVVFHPDLTPACTAGSSGFGMFQDDRPGQDKELDILGI